MSDDKKPLSPDILMNANQDVLHTESNVRRAVKVERITHIDKSANSRHDTGDVSKNEADYDMSAPATSQLKETGAELKAPVKPREFWILREEQSNRALTREHGEKWPDDIKGEPSNGWLQVIDKSAYIELQAERDELKAQLAAMTEDRDGEKNTKYLALKSLKQALEREKKLVEALKKIAYEESGAPAGFQATSAIEANSKAREEK